MAIASIKIGNVLDNSLDFIERINKNKKQIPSYNKILKALSLQDYKTFFTECLFRIELLAKLKVFNYNRKDLNTIVDAIHRVTIYPIADALVAKYGNTQVALPADNSSIGFLKAPIDKQKLSGISKKEFASFKRLYPKADIKVKDFYYKVQAILERLNSETPISSYETGTDYNNLCTALYDIAYDLTCDEFGGEYEDEASEDSLATALLEAVDVYLDVRNTKPYKLYCGEDVDLNESEDIDDIIMSETFTDDTVIGYVPDEDDVEEDSIDIC